MRWGSTRLLIDTFKNASRPIPIKAVEECLVKNGYAVTTLSPALSRLVRAGLANRDYNSGTIKFK